MLNQAAAFLGHLVMSYSFPYVFPHLVSVYVQERHWSALPCRAFAGLLCEGCATSQKTLRSALPSALSESRAARAAPLEPRYTGAVC